MVEDEMESEIEDPASMVPDASDEDFPGGTPSMEDDYTSRGEAPESLRSVTGNILIFLGIAYFVIVSFFWMYQKFNLERGGYGEGDVLISPASVPINILVASFLMVLGTLMKVVTRGRDEEIREDEILDDEPTDEKSPKPFSLTRE